MLISLDGWVFNSANGATPTGPPLMTGQSGAQALPSFQNCSNFPKGAVTTVSPSGLACTVFADMSIWCQTLQAFVPPERTNISSKLDQGSGS